MVVTKSIISTRGYLLSKSSCSIVVVGEISERIFTSCKPADTSLRLHRERLLCLEIIDLWNLIWSNASTGEQTDCSFPQWKPFSS